MVDDRDDVGEALAGARAGRQDVMVTRPSNLDGIGLVGVETEGFSLIYAA